MNKSLNLALSGLLVAALSAFVVITCRALPETVASHFSMDGTANGFMSRYAYTTMMLGVVVVLPVLMAFVPSALAKNGGAGLNIPHREYWLAPQRYGQTVAWLGFRSKLFAAVLAVFLAYMHGLVVLANTHVPAVLPRAAFYAGLAVFLVFIALWVGLFYARFGRRD